MLIRKYLLWPIRIFYDEVFSPVYKRRLAKIVASLCEDDSYILDYGCDDGSVAEMIMEYNPSLRIVGVDIQANRPSKIPRKIYNGTKIPYPNNTFDIVICLDVLHHTKDMSVHVKEMRRVSKKYLIIKDHMIYSFFSRMLISFSDFTSNVPYGIKCEFNFLTKKQWYSLFKKQNLKIVKNPKNLNLGFSINEKYNPIFKLKKK